MSNQDLLTAVGEVWRIPAPISDNLLAHPAIQHLTALCTARFGGGERMRFSVIQALRSLGLPAEHVGEAPLGVAQATQSLEEGFSRTSALQRHLIPLDLAADLPPLTFGTNRIARFTASELAALFDAPRLARLYPRWPLDSRRLSEFFWLIVDEEVALDPCPEKRTFPFFFERLASDLGAFEPHAGRFPFAVERALFFLLLAPWEDTGEPEVDWRGFCVPWIYTLDTDLVARPRRPPDPDTLTWVEDVATDAWGEPHEFERPEYFHGRDDAATLEYFDEAAWLRSQLALASPLFATPIVHFVVRAFSSNKIDEFIAHMTAIEAALGMESDHRRWTRPKPYPHHGLHSTARIAGRIAGLLRDSAAARKYIELFEVRSAFIHGRSLSNPISSDQRITARRLTRRIVAALVGLASTSTDERELVLDQLLDQGAPMMSKPTP